MRFTKTLFTTALFGASVFSLQSTAWAIEQQKDFKAILEIVPPLAEQGDANAQALLGRMYEEGVGVKQDNVKAVKWYSRAAEQGIAEAQFNLGNMYVSGQGVKQDDVKALKWFRKAAEQGFAPAQFNLGVMYYNGRGVQVNKSLAKEWLGKACDNGDQQGCEFYGKLNRGEM